MKASTKENVLEFVRTIAIAILIAVVILVFLKPTLVKQTSMVPSISSGDYLIVSRQAYRMTDIKRGDIVVFTAPESDGGGNKLLIKRVIGLPGDVITVTKGDLWINGEKMQEDYIAKGGTPGELYNVTVPKDSLFVLGDHREVSVDSRAFGCIKESSVRGKAVLRLFPTKTAGWLN